MGIFTIEISLLLSCFIYCNMLRYNKFNYDTINNIPNIHNNIYTINLFLETFLPDWIKVTVAMPLENYDEILALNVIKNIYYNVCFLKIHCISVIYIYINC